MELQKATPQYPDAKSAVEKTKIAIFASGGGSNAEKIMAHFHQHPTITVVLVVSNRKEAGVLAVAQARGIETLIVSKSIFYESEKILDDLKHRNIDFIALAGFLLLVPNYIINKFHKKIVNIHPALLPKFGGHGMYGMNVHRAVKAENALESGITIHFANPNYDEGDIIFQANIALAPEDSAEGIAKKVLALEHRFFPSVIESLLTHTPLPIANPPIF